jgi:hypothetical protein
MNQKVLRYFLFAALAVVWGLIIYKIINGSGHRDSAAPLLSVKGETSYHSPQDSFILIANYSDPFLPDDSVDSEEMDKTATAEIKKEAVTAKPKFDLNKILYRGMISNPETKKKVAIVSISGKDYMAKEKERIDEVLIRKITRENLTVIIDGKAEHIGRTSN